MENDGFLNLDSNTEKEEVRNDGKVNKTKRRRSTRKYSVKLKESIMELNELSKQSYCMLSESNETHEIAKAKKNRTIDNLDDNGFAALHQATRYNRAGTIERLLTNGANVNVTTRDDRFTPLHISARFGYFEATELLLKHGADPILPTTSGATAVHLACRRGDLGVIRLLLDHPKVDVNIKDNLSLTPLHITAAQGNEDAACLLLDRGADVFALAADKTTPLHVAVMNTCVTFGGNKTAVHILKRGFQLANSEDFITSSYDMDGYNMLHVAAFSNSLEIVQMAVDEMGVDVDIPNETNNKTALHIACKMGFLQMVESLVERGANVHGRDTDGRTSLHHAARMGREEVIEFLIDHGAIVDVRDNFNKTPMLVACSIPNGSVDAVRVLIAKGAKINANDGSMKNSLHLAVEAGNCPMVKYFLDEMAAQRSWGNLTSPDVEERVPLHYAALCDDLQVIQSLVKTQSRLNYQDEKQQTALYLAAKTNRPNHVDTLGRAGASVKERDANGQTALHVAATNGNRKVCKKLLSLGADVNTRDTQNKTPVICAATCGCVKTIKVLLDRNANIDDASAAGDTALLTAIRNNNCSVVKLLLDRNVNVTHRDFTGLGVFETAVKWDAKECVEVICSHERWKEVLSTTADGATRARPLHILIRFFPEAAKIVMNKCIEKPISSNPLRHDYTVTYDFRFLDPGPDDPEFLKGNRYFGPLCMVKYNRRELLHHPLTQMLLDVKWSSFGYLYYTSFLLYLCFVVTYSYFLVVKREQERWTFAGNFTYKAALSDFYQAEGVSYNFALVLIIFVSFQLLKEIFQIFFQRLQYFKQPENLLEWLLYSTCFVFLIPYVAGDNYIFSLYGRFYNPTNLWMTAIISAFFSYVNFVLFMRRFVWFGIYVTMFLEVFKSLFKVMLVFLQFIIAFSVVFYILFIEQPSFNTFRRAFMKTNIMMVGEIDFTSTFVDSEDQYIGGLPLNPFPQIGYLFCAIFVYAMSITLMNLLIGIAIGDIDGVQKTAELKRLAMQVDFVAQIEEKYPPFITRRLYKASVENKPNRKSFLTRLKTFQKVCEGTLRNLSSASEDQYSDLSEAVDLNNMAATLEKNRKQIKALTAAMERQTAMITEMARKMNTEVKPEVLDHPSVGP